MQKDDPLTQRGRPKSFDHDCLVESVMELFWEDGYEAISLSKVAQKMNLNRSSLYNSFETKEKLFLECLDCYISKSPTARLRDFQKGQNVGKLLFEVLNQICEIRANDTKNRGCLAANSFLELINKNTQLGKELLKRNNLRRNNIISLVEQAIFQGELTKDKDPLVTANIMLSFMMGLNYHAKLGTSEKDLKDMCQEFLINTGFQTPK